MVGNNEIKRKIIENDEKQQVYVYESIYIYAHHMWFLIGLSIPSKPSLDKATPCIANMSFFE